MKEINTEHQQSISDNIKRGTYELLLLSLLEKEDMYGYQLSQKLAQQTDSLFMLTGNILYPLLHRMADKGYIAERKEMVGKRIRVYYHLEPLGVEYLKKIKNEYISINCGILKVLKLESL